ncbi:integral membrane protein [Companilactobacillus tucceti DSM 20183]|uniref:Integral membrane protein n=1 Tax=Companilactobacillus tucceti DSM 20183 TaxID=1423811 RepID=A0A0R1J381_9LACO|nr:TMEM175 family protein [Companilactobacillus tucceti]KRK65766.1 integral membrane protein [Companilactobacillus tucceti DSM 20183]
MFKNSKSRLDAISDGIFAVVLTIMVLNIKVPESVSATSIHQLIKEIIIYLISVDVVSQYWFFHQEMFNSIKEVKSHLMILNMCFLTTVSLIPFATAWLNNNLFSKITVITFALILTSANFFQYLLFRLILIDSTQINKHDLEEKRSALIMLISSFGYLLIGGIYPPSLLILVILSLFIRSTVAFILRKV